MHSDTLFKKRTRLQLHDLQWKLYIGIYKEWDEGSCILTTDLETVGKIWNSYSKYDPFVGRNKTTKRNKIQKSSGFGTKNQIQRSLLVFSPTPSPTWPGWSLVLMLGYWHKTRTLYGRTSSGLGTTETP